VLVRRCDEALRRAFVYSDVSVLPPHCRLSFALETLMDGAIDAPRHVIAYSKMLSRCASLRMWVALAAYFMCC
jgi:hypothetical protein